MAYVAKTYGRLPLAQDLAPAIELAEKGFSFHSRILVAYPGSLAYCC
jgi:gamma-glutamyltranspeptidase